MMLQVFTVFDKAVGAYLQPFYSRAKGEAVRSFADACNDEKSNFRKYASDYVLMFLGEFDDQSGTFACVDPVRIISAVECIVSPDDVFTEDKRIGEKVKRLPM